MKDFFTFSGFTPALTLCLSLGFLLAFVSFFLHLRKKTEWALLLLTLGGFCLYLFSALADPYLHPWDERFHALVAQNMMSHPFVPTLYRELPFQEVDPSVWSHAHIWLHKQPLFLWQIALSFRIFGVSMFSLRFPSVLMATLLIPIGYRIASLLVDKRFGFYTALSAAFSWFLLNLVSGHGDVDHNNVCFVFYVTASIWAWSEYLSRERRFVWVLLIGLFSGCAILTKWVTGLLVYLVWGIYLLSKHLYRLKEWKIGHLATALAVTLAVVLPWQLYILHTFPELSRWEYALGSMHFSSVIEEHGADGLYYVRTLPYIYIGDALYAVEGAGVFSWLRITNLVLLLAGFVQMLRMVKGWSLRLSILLPTLFIYVFFSLAATKMPGYPFCICMVFFMALAIYPYWVETILENRVSRAPFRSAVMLLFLSLFSLYQLNFTCYRSQHTSLFWAREQFLQNVEAYKQIGKAVGDRAVVFNVCGQEDWGCRCQVVDAMFYSGALCYASLPTPKKLEELKQQGYQIAVLTSHPVPDFMSSDPEVVKIDAIIQGDF